MTRVDSDQDLGSAIDQAYEDVKGLILTGRIAPGSPFIVNEMAERMDMSRNPIRVAREILLQEGLLKVSAIEEQRTRRVVAPLTEEDANDLFSLVASIERVSVKRGTKVEGQKDLVEVHTLRTLAEEMEEAISLGQSARKRFLTHNAEFHRVIVRVGAGDRLRAQHSIFYPQTDRYLNSYGTLGRLPLSELLSEYRKMVEAINDGDSKTARKAVSAYWEQVQSQLLQDIREVGARGDWP